MSLTCNRCGGTGFLNIDQLPFDVFMGDGPPYTLLVESVLKWIEENETHDVQVCDCCGDGEDWYGMPGEHYNDDDPPGTTGPYAYNGGLCECH